MTVVWEFRVSKTNYLFISFFQYFRQHAIEALGNKVRQTINWLNDKFTLLTNNNEYIILLLEGEHYFIENFSTDNDLWKKKT